MQQKLAAEVDRSEVSDDARLGIGSALRELMHDQASDAAQTFGSGK